MRHDEPGLVDHVVPVQNQIQIERARRAEVRPRPAEAMLDREQSIQQRTGRERRIRDQRAVQDGRLRILADVRRLVERGDANVEEDGLKRGDGVAQG